MCKRTTPAAISMPPDNPPSPQQGGQTFFMKPIKILSGTSILFVLFLSVLMEIGVILLCIFTPSSLFIPSLVAATIFSIGFILMLIVSNRAVTIVAYHPEKEIVTSRGLLGGFYRELSVANIVRTEVRFISKEEEYILLLDKEDNQCFDSLSPDMPIRVPNTTKGRAFIASFYHSGQ